MRPTGGWTSVLNLIMSVSRQARSALEGSSFVILGIEGTTIKLHHGGDQEKNRRAEAGDGHGERESGSQRNES